MQVALQVNVLFLIGLILSRVIYWALKAASMGLIRRVVGDSTDAARAMGPRPNVIRTLATAPTCRSTFQAAGTRAFRPVMG